MINSHQSKICSQTVMTIAGCQCALNQECGNVLTDGTGAHQADLAFQKCYDLDPSEVLNLDLAALVLDTDLGAEVNIVKVKEFFLGNGALVTTPNADVTFTPILWTGPTGAAFTVDAGGCFFDSSPVNGWDTPAGGTFSLTNTDAVNALRVCLKIVGTSA